VAVVAAIGLGGCGDPLSEPAGVGQAPEPVGEAAVAPAGDLLVPGTGPVGLTARLVERQGPAEPVTGDDARLYADANGHRVVLHHEHGHPNGPLPDGIHIANGSVGDADAFTAEIAGGWWVRWQPDNGSQDPATFVVFAEGVDEPRARAIAEAVRWDVESRTIGVTDPEGLGLVDIAHVPGLSIAYLADPQGPFRTTGVRWSPAGGEIFDEPTLTVSTWKYDEALSAMLRAVVDGEVGEVRGAPGAAGTLILPGGEKRLVRTWDEQGMTVLVVASGLDRGALDDIVAGLRPATDDDWRLLTEQATVPPPLEKPGIQGRFGTGSWSFAVEGTEPAKLFLSISIVLADGETEGHSGGLVGVPLAVDTAQVDEGTLIAGVADAGTARVVLLWADGTSVEPELTRLEVAGGVQVFGHWSGGVLELPRVSAFDASGTELGFGGYGSITDGPGA
jgi:hypothetical protein